MGTTKRKSTIETQKGKAIQTKLKIAIKLQEKGIKEEESKKTQKIKSKIINKMAMKTYISNYLKCKWIKCFNQKIETG